MFHRNSIHVPKEIVPALGVRLYEAPLGIKALCIETLVPDAGVAEETTTATPFMASEAVALDEFIVMLIVTRIGFPVVFT
jgi:hypothetical protein